MSDNMNSRAVPGHGGTISGETTVVNPSDYQNLPEGYSVLSYIESTGTQYIDTKCAPSNNFRVVIDGIITKTSMDEPAALIHVKDANGKMFGLCYDPGMYDFEGCFVFCYNTSSQNIYDNYENLNVRNVFEINQNKFLLNGTELATISSSTFDCVENLYLFTQNKAGTTSSYLFLGLRLYSCQMYAGDLLVRDFIPVMNDKGTCGLWDRNTEEFYANSGTGTFVAGEVLYTKPNTYPTLPVSWSVLSYIESTGTQYIDTGFIPNQDTRVMMKLVCPVTSGTTKWVFGARVSSTSNRFTFAGSTNGYYASSYNNLPGSIDASYNTDQAFELDKNKNITYINSVEVSNLTYSAFSAKYNMVLFGCNTNGSITKGKCKIYSCQIYDNGTLVRDYIPVVTNDGIYGLWDAVNKSLYTNNGTGTFIAGEIIFTKTKEPYIHPVLEKTKQGISPRRRLIESTNKSTVGGSIAGETKYLLVYVPDDIATIQWTQASGATGSLYYSYDTKTWTLFNSGETITVTSDRPVGFKGNLKPVSGKGIGQFLTTSGSCHLSGNCMSLLFMDDAENQFDLTGYDYAFYNLFKDCQGLFKIGSGFSLPATTLASYCYYGMFSGCYDLMELFLELPAETVPMYAYVDMFGNCISLTSAGGVSMNAKVLGSYSCMGMFAECSALTNTPNLSSVITVGNSCCEAMFSMCTSLTTINGFPSSTASSSYCYSRMFYGCSSLTTMPTIPLTSTTDNCCSYMFYNCSKLSTLTTLKAKTVAIYAYSNMFRYCTSITTIPTISATTIKDYGCDSMFCNCTKLKTASSSNFKPTSLGNYACSSMFGQCTVLTTAPNLVATSGTMQYACKTMFTGCTSLVTAPTINSTMCGKGAKGCFESMFYNCSKLNSNPFASTTIKGISRTFYSMFYGCKALAKDFSSYTLQLTEDYSAFGMFAECIKLTKGIKITGTLGYSSCSSMYSGCTSLNYSPDLPSTLSSGSCCTRMFENCTKLRTAPALPATALVATCYYYMFRKCTSLETAPELPATTLKNSCYEHMFEGCTSLIVAPELPATTLATECYSNMFYNCNKLRIAPELPATNITVDQPYEQMFQSCDKLNYINLSSTEFTYEDADDPFNNYTGNNWIYNMNNTIGIFVKNPNATYSVTDSEIVPSGWLVVNSNVPKILVKRAQSQGTTTYLPHHYIVYDQGMTWRQWINSEYNIYGYYMQDDDSYSGVFCTFDSGWYGYSLFCLFEGVDKLDTAISGSEIKEYCATGGWSLEH